MHPDFPSAELPVAPAETGLWEMQQCVQRSGGQVLQAETFGASHLRKSLERLMVHDGDDALCMGYGATFELRTSRECASIQVLGTGVSEGEGEDAGTKVDSSEVKHAGRVGTGGRLERGLERKMGPPPRRWLSNPVGTVLLIPSGHHIV